MDIRELTELAVAGLAPMFDHRAGLFCERLRLTPSGMVREGLSRRYSLMACLGLQAAEASGMQLPVDSRAIVQRLASDSGWVDDLGDLGLLVWSCALTLSQNLARLYNVAGVRQALQRFPHAKQGRTMQLGWFLAGLSHASMVAPELSASMKPLAFETYELLRCNQGRHGYFGHLATTKSLAGFVRGRIGSFADQVYPIYAFSQFGRAFNHAEAIENARRCADAICRAQGPLGQWWWHYDSAAGRVVEQYPVFSVHQDGMAPMALFAAAHVAGVDYSAPVDRGLCWIAGSNERQFDMRDIRAGVIWRSIYHSDERKLHARRMLRAAGWDRGGETTIDLAILRECRPYHLGWLLYAYCGCKLQPKGAPVCR